MEIGFGNGAALAAMAAAEPEKNFIGVEVHKPGVGALLARVAAAGLANVRIISADVIAVLEHMIEVDSLAGVRLFFPDPWPKKRHHKRRLVQPAFLDMLAAKMRSGGLLHMATDWQNYSEQMLELLVAHPDFLNTAADNGYITRPEWRPLTHFEQRGTRLGHDVWDILFTRC
jgi:tRNA (guanine-N7-)-methyltransferase